MAFIFGLLITIIGITLQFASAKTTPQVTRFVRVMQLVQFLTAQFFKDKIILGLMVFVLVSNVAVMWVFLESGDKHTPHLAVGTCLVPDFLLFAQLLWYLLPLYN